MVSPETTSGPRAEARRYVLCAAARALAEDPQASIQDIAVASGVGRATVYRWFACREQLIEAIHAEVAAQADEIVLSRLAEGGPALERLLRVSRDIIALGDTYRFLAAQGETRKARRSGAATEALEAHIARAQRAGELRADLPAEWLSATFSGLLATACRELSRGEATQERVEEMVGRTITAAFAPVSGPS
jgi:AcrR family transcriptional regulator